MAPRRYNLQNRARAVEETRRRIVEAIVALHAEKGVVATTIQDIAHRADVAAGTVLRHFPSLESMVRACHLRLVEITKPPTPAMFATVRAFPQRVKLLLRELFAFYERAAPWIEVGRSERKKVPALEEGIQHLESALEALIREVLQPTRGNGKALHLATALTDFCVWKSLSAKGKTTAVAAELVGDVLLSWMNQAPCKQRGATRKNFMVGKAKLERRRVSP